MQVRKKVGQKEASAVYFWTELDCFSDLLSDGPARVAQSRSALDGCHWKDSAVSYVCGVALGQPDEIMGVPKVAQIQYCHKVYSVRLSRSEKRTLVPQSLLGSFFAKRKTNVSATE